MFNNKKIKQLEKRNLNLTLDLLELQELVIHLADRIGLEVSQCDCGEYIVREFDIDE